MFMTVVWGREQYTDDFAQDCDNTSAFISNGVTTVLHQVIHSKNLAKKKHAKKNL